MREQERRRIHPVLSPDKAVTITNIFVEACNTLVVKNPDLSPGAAWLMGVENQRKCGMDIFTIFCNSL